jgi:hypothetical protein
MTELGTLDEFLECRLSLEYEEVKLLEDKVCCMCFNRFDCEPRRFYIMASPLLRAQAGNPDKSY